MELPALRRGKKKKKGKGNTMFVALVSRTLAAPRGQSRLGRKKKKGKEGFASL